MKRILFVLAFLVSQQIQQPQQTGSIDGSVFKLGTTEAIPRAKVTLSAAGSNNSKSVTADDGGKFVFRELTPGQYRLSATRDGYVTAEYGQRGPGSSGVPIQIAPQQQMKDARIGMTPTGAISGRILNRYGEPVGNANVQALRYTYQEGRRSLTTVQSIRTNDLGEYRLFWMTPGQYVISAQPQESLSVDPGGTVFVQALRGAGGPALAGALAGAQLGVGGVTRITVSGAGGGPAPDFPGGLVPPPPPPPPPPGANTADDSNLYLPVYYPGTTDVTAAAPVDLRAGGNVGGINLSVVEARPVRIRGQVLSSGRPAAGAQVSIYQRNTIGGNLTIRNVPVNDMGNFEFRNIAPGGYELVATMNASGPGALIAGTPLGNAAGFSIANVAPGRGGRVPGAPMMAARAQVDVLNTDVENVSLLLENGFTVNGRVSIEGQASDTLAGARIQLQTDPLIPPLAVPAVVTEADGSFSFTGLAPGTYRLTVAGLPRTYVKSAVLAGVDVLNGGARLDGEPRGALNIVLGTNAGSLDATALDARKMPVPAVTVVLVPNDAQRKRYDIYRQATSDASGRIHLDNVVPGDYKIFAWEVVESNAWTDSDYLRNFENNGVAVHVAEGGRATVEAQVIPFKTN
jgi:Carboxypeptidase regulatory-like domain